MKEDFVDKQTASLAEPPASSRASRGKLSQHGSEKAHNCQQRSVSGYRCRVETVNHNGLPEWQSSRPTDSGVLDGGHPAAKRHRAGSWRVTPGAEQQGSQRNADYEDLSRRAFEDMPSCGGKPQSPAVLPTRCQAQLDSVSSALSELTRATIAPEQLACLLAGTDGSVPTSHDASQNLQSWISAINAAVQQGGNSPEAHLLLARLKSSSSVQSPTANELTDQGSVVFGHQPSPLTFNHKAYSRVKSQHTSLAAQESGLPLETGERPGEQEAIGRPGGRLRPPSDSTASHKARVFDRTPQNRLAVGQPLLGKSKSVTELRVHSGPKLQESKSARPQFRVYSNAYQNPGSGRPTSKSQLSEGQRDSFQEDHTRRAIRKRPQEEQRPKESRSEPGNLPAAAFPPPLGPSVEHIATLTSRSGHRGPQISSMDQLPHDLGISSAPFLPPFQSPALHDEQLAAWLRQRYSTLGQALSVSEANLKRLTSQQSNTPLPLAVLARLQAAQQLHGAAAAQGGLQAAAALAPLMQLQALAQSIGSISGSVNPLAAIPETSPFSSLEAWRENFSQLPEVPTRGQQAGTSPSSWGGLMRRSSPDLSHDTLNATNSLDLQGEGQLQPPRMMGIAPSASEGEARQQSRASLEKVPPTQVEADGNDPSFGRGMPDPHNPFEMHRLRMAREGQLPLGITLASTEENVRGKGVGPTERSKLVPNHHSAPPLSLGFHGRLGSAFGEAQPRAATVKRSLSKDTEEEAEEQAAATLLSMFEPGQSRPPDATHPPSEGQNGKELHKPRHQKRFPVQSEGPPTSEHRSILGMAVPHAPRSLLPRQNLYGRVAPPQAVDNREHGDGVQRQSKRRRNSADSSRARTKVDDEGWFPHREAKRLPTPEERDVSEDKSRSDLTESL